MEKTHTIKIMFILLFALVLYITFLIIKPFLTGIVAGLILSYMFYPVYQLIFRFTKMERLSAVIVCILVLCVILFPFLIIGAAMVNEAQDLVRLSQGIDITATACVDSDELLCQGISWLHRASSDPFYANVIETGIHNGVTFFVSMVKGFVTSLPSVIAQVFIAVFICFYMVKDGQNIIQYIEEMIPLKPDNRKSIARQVNNTIKGVLYGQVILGFIQGILAVIGYYLFGIPSPLTLGLLTLVASFIPVFGTAVIWLPAGLIKIFESAHIGDTTGMYLGIGLLAWGVLIVGSSDNLLRPKIVGQKARIHPVLVILGVFGGLALFGMIGLILGPILLAIFAEFARIYMQERETFRA